MAKVRHAVSTRPTIPRTVRNSWALVFSLLSCILPRSARADDTTPPPAPATTSDTVNAEPFVAFPLKSPHEKHYLRSGLEVGGIILVGLVDYLLNTTARGGSLRPGELRWNLRYDPAVFRGKFTGDSYAWDANRFGTNFVSHPFAGTMYFTAARSNHLSFLEAYAFAIVGSGIWEYFGEIREINSVNDMIITPVAGTAIGETMMQLAGFFDRGDARFSNRFLAFLFSPWKFVNDGIDGAETVRTSRPDALGLPREPWHRFTLDVAAGATIQEPVVPGSAHAKYTDWRLALDLDLANLPDYAGTGHWSRVYDDGNRARLTVEGTLSEGHLVDGRFASRLVPFGYYYRDAETGRDGRLRGQGALIGVRMGFEYAMHDYDRDRARATDLIAIVSPLGIAAEYGFDRGGFHLRTSFELSAGLAGVRPYALSDYERLRGRDGLPTVTRNNGYDYSFEVSVEPRVALGFRTVHWDSTFRLDTFRGSQTMDEAGHTVDQTLTLVDRRTTLRTSLAWEPEPLRFSLSLARNARAGQIGAIYASRTETSLMAAAGVAF